MLSPGAAIRQPPLRQRSISVTSTRPCSQLVTSRRKCNVNQRTAQRRSRCTRWSHVNQAYQRELARSLEKAVSHSRHQSATSTKQEVTSQTVHTRQEVASRDLDTSGDGRRTTASTWKLGATRELSAALGKTPKNNSISLFFRSLLRLAVRQWICRVEIPKVSLMWL